MPKKKDSLTERYKNVLVGSGVILLLVAGILYIRSRQPTETLPPIPEEILVQEEGVVKRSGEATQVMSEEEIKQMREEVEAALIGAEQTAKLTSVVETPIVGEAYRAYSDGRFYFKLTAQNLVPQDKGYYYESWFKNGQQYLSAGRVEVDSLGNGVVYYQASADRSDYPEVVVTLEPEDGNPAPATHVLAGSF